MNAQEKIDLTEVRYRYWIECRLIGLDGKPLTLWRLVEEPVVHEDEAEQRSLLETVREEATRSPYGPISPGVEYRLCRSQFEVVG